MSPFMSKNTENQTQTTSSKGDTTPSNSIQLSYKGLVLLYLKFFCKLGIFIVLSSILKKKI
jgi:hypothetical protein